MNVADAAYCVVHDYPGGSEALAPRMGMSAAVLRNKVNPNTPSHRLSLEEADKLTALTGDTRIVEAFAAQHGFALRTTEEAAQAPSILHAMTAASAARGAMWNVIQSAIADNRITHNEFSEIERASMEATSAERVLLEAFRSQVPKCPAGQE
jgi:regulatory protein CII